MKGDIYYNQSGYYDPTAGQALENIICEEMKAAEKPKKRRKRRRRRKSFCKIQGGG
jgi:hypothetical protein